VSDAYLLAGTVLRCLDPETAHGLAVRAVRWGLAPRSRLAPDPALRQSFWGLDFANVVGLAAGFDKHAELGERLFDLGFGFVELGGVTPRPQIGNPRPRLFRLTEDHAVINRFGLNSVGVEEFARRLAGRARRGVIGVNIGYNKDSADPVADYIACTRALSDVVDYLSVNVSSPNTPGLRDMQGRAKLAAILDGVLGALARKLPVLVKIAPDLADEDLADIVAVAQEKRIDGLIVANTTIQRPAALRSRHRSEAGGLSGRPLFAISTEILRKTYRLSGGTLPLIGCGGIASGADAYAKIRAGASLVQLYSALVWRGPRLVDEIRATLVELLQRDGFTHVSQAIGADHRRSS
jgi:dihydroorotate dehydrogenase